MGGFPSPEWSPDAMVEAAVLGHAHLMDQDRIHRTGGRLVCGLGSDDGGSRVAGVAARLGTDLSCGVTLVHVMDSVQPLPLGVRPRIPATARKAQRDLATVTSLHDFPPRTRVRVEWGDPVESLAEVASDEDAELLVVGSSDPRGLASLLPGGTAGALIRKSPCPVVVVPPDAVRPPDSGPLPAVVCGVEGGELDAPILRLAADVARRLAAELHAVHTFNPFALSAGVMAPAPPIDLDFRAAAERTLADALEEAGVTAHRHVLDIPPEPALRRIAGEERAGLIVVGASKRSRLGALLQGSVPIRLAKEGHTALLVLPEVARLESGSGHYELDSSAA